MTFSQPMNRRQAAKALEVKLEALDIGANPIYPAGGDLYVDKIKISEPSTYGNMFRAGMKAGFTNAVRLRGKLEPIEGK